MTYFSTTLKKINTQKGHHLMPRLTCRNLSIRIIQKKQKLNIFVSFYDILSTTRIGQKAEIRFFHLAQ